MLFTHNLIFHFFNYLISINNINIYNRLLLFKELLLILIEKICSIEIIKILIVIIRIIKKPLIISLIIILIIIPKK